MEDGKHHILGELLVEPKDAQRELFMELKPLLAVADRRNAIMISQMPRYLKTSCCADKSHCVNITDNNYKQNMMGALQEAKHNIKDLLFYAGKRNIKVLDPNMVINSMIEGEVWGHDPVHPLPLVYNKIGSQVVKLAMSMGDVNERKRRRDSTGEFSGSQRTGGGGRGGDNDSGSYRGAYNQRFGHVGSGRSFGTTGPNRGRGSHGGRPH
jgi:hypothetical protein